MTQPKNDAPAALEKVMAEARATASVAALLRNRSLRLSLKAMSFAAHADFMRVLTAYKPRSLWHSDVSDPPGNFPRPELLSKAAGQLSKRNVAVSAFPRGNPLQGH